MDIKKYEIEKVSKDCGGTYSIREVLSPAEIRTGDELNAELKQLEAKIAEIPTEPTDKELLAWARENYPFLDHRAERDYLQGKIDEIKEILEVE